MTSLLQQTRYQVAPEGTQCVTLTLGNVPITMDYQTALAISQDLRIVARRVKRLAGDTSLSLSARGQLTDANDDEREAQRLRDPTASFR